jgi:hypothetical protein
MPLAAVDTTRAELALQQLQRGFLRVAARRASYRRRLGAFENYPSPLTHHGRHEERHHLYRCFVTPTFTREVDVLPEGRQLENGTAKCARGMQGSMHCETGEHGFVISYTRGQNW